MRSLWPMSAFSMGFLSVVSLAAQQPAPTLELRTTTGQTTFHIGERISLTLTLTGPDNKKYSIDTAGYDRSGRLDIDTFAVSPGTGSTDPLAQYFSQEAFMGGGLRGSELLSSKPFSITADLNEHIRFDQPGMYAITATSHRVGTASKDLFPREPYLSLQSKPIEIHVVPATADWQAERLRAVLEILTKPDKQAGMGMPARERTEAVADLRFLNSPASIEKLASYLRDDSENQLMWAAALGLAGVPDSERDRAIHAMSSQLDDPAFPVSSFFLTIMSELETSPTDWGVDRPGSESDLLQSHRPAFKTVWHYALSGLARKQGAALASTAETLLATAPDGEAAEVKTQIAGAVANSFTALPIDRQIPQLQYNWDELKRHSMLPVLQAVLHSQPHRSSSLFYSAADLNAVVLKRWFELDPDGAVREVTLQLDSPNAPLSPEDVASLPGGPQPQFEQRWAKELAESKDDERQTLLAALMVRFGTGSATAQVEDTLGAHVGKWACKPQGAALAYVVKFKSPNAAGLVHRALTLTRATRCYETLFASVSAFGQGPALNEAAIFGIENANPRAAAGAAEYLKYFGTESAKQPLLERYRQWSEQWASKPGGPDPSDESEYPLSLLGHNLGEALIANQGWLADPKLIAEVLSRCVGEEVCRQLRELASEASSPKLTVSLSGSAPFESYRIGPYTAKNLELFEAKLDQFPSGTQFGLTRTEPRNGDQVKLERTAVALFRKHGFTLEEAAGPALAKSFPQ